MGHPVGPAVDSGPHVVGAFGRRLLAGDHLGATLIVETLDPGLLHESLGEQELARAAVQQIIEPIAVGPGHHLALLSAKLAVEQDRDLGRVPVVGVVRRELIVPLELSGIGIDGEHGAGVKIVAGAEIAVVVRPRIARSPIDEIQIRVIGAVVPGGGPAGLPRIAGPGSEAGLAGLRDGVEAPEMLAGGRVVGVEESGNAVLAASHSDDELIFDDQGCARGGVATGLGVVVHLGLPQLAAGLGVHGDHVHVERVHEQAISKYRQAAVHAPAAIECARRILMTVGPQDAAGERVERVNLVLRPGQVHDAVDDERRGLELLLVPSLEQPLDVEVLDVLRRDLIEAAEAPAIVAVRIGEPVSGLLIGLEQPFVGDRQTLGVE